MSKQKTLFETYNNSSSKTAKAAKNKSTSNATQYSDDNGYNILLNLYKTNKNVLSYLKSLNDREKIVLNIAYADLESSFDIEKSQGYKTWSSIN